MKVTVSDYIADFLAAHDISTVFTVVGGGAMHLNNSFGHHKELVCLYNHHEQASSMAADAYFRVHGRMAAVCVTSGPGALNALNGVVGAYQDSIPMLVFSGQTKTSLTVYKSGLKLRALGNQEFNIVDSLHNMVKYAEMIMEPSKIRYCLEKAYAVALQGRPGPCWLDIPLDIQGTYIETDDLKGYSDGEQYYSPSEVIEEAAEKIQDDSELEDSAQKIAQRLKASKRPVLYAGNGIRISGSTDRFKQLVHLLKLPVVTCWDSIDLMETDDDLYTGRGGTMGDRAGNFAVQNSDLLICIGTRLNIYQVGYDVKTWAREAYVAVNDIDSEELKKPTVHMDLGICCDAGVFMEKLQKAALDIGVSGDGYEEWAAQCLAWKRKYKVVQQKHYDNENSVNVYAFTDTLSKMLPQNSVTVVANGSASVVGSQAYYINDGCRFLMNCGISSMGYGLPAAIGACMANDRHDTICLEGDGSIMMNLQELQTVVTNRLPIKIFVINNNGYHQIRLTQNNIFKNGLIGVGPDSGDLGFPDFEKLAYAFDIPYIRISDMKMMGETLQKVLHDDGYIICEVMCDTEQIFEPKSSAKKLDDGTLVSPPLEDMAPFLTREELKENMYIDLV